MTINLKIQADIIDIRVDCPTKNDIFLVDTNVWLWQTYFSSRPSSSNFIRSKISDYTPYVAAALLHGTTLTYSGLIFSELAHVIEKTEFRIYKNSQAITAKEYRHNYLTERAKVVAEVQLSWSQVESMAVPVNLQIDDATTQAALKRFQSQALDGYDLLLLEAISRSGVDQVKVLTDDMDYAVVPNIQVFTSNEKVINSAKGQGKLVVR